MKKLARCLSSLLLFFSLNSLADLASHANPCVSVPISCGSFTFGLSALYWRPCADQVDYALIYPKSGLDDKPFKDGQYYNAQPSYNWSFKVNIGYIFAGSGNDINMSYTHYHDNGQDDIQDFAFAFPTLTGPTFPAEILSIPVPLESVSLFGQLIPSDDLFSGILKFPAHFQLAANFDPHTVTKLSARSEFESHILDLTFGQAINVGCRWRLHCYEGLRYFSLNQSLNSTMLATGVFVPPTPVTQGDLTVTIQPVTGPSFEVPEAHASLRFGPTAVLQDVECQASDFDGIGPRMGFDINYDLGCGLSLAGGLSGSLIVGGISSRFSEQIFVNSPVVIDASIHIPDLSGATVTRAQLTPDSTPVVLVSYEHPNELRVVPNLDAKLAINYNYFFCNKTRTRLVIELGYNVNHYFAGIDRLSKTGATHPEFRTRNTLDMNFDGPYVGFQINL